MVRHVGWGLTWIIVGFATVLGVAGILEQRALHRELRRTPAVEPAAPPAGKPRPAEPGHSLIVATRR